MHVLNTGKRTFATAQRGYLQIPGLHDGKLTLYAVLMSSSDILSRLLFKAHSQAFLSNASLAGISLSVLKSNQLNNTTRALLHR